MNNKAFTLVELLGVIIILSLLAVATFTVIDGVIKRNTDSVENVQVAEILDGAISYATTTKGVRLPNVIVGTSGCINGITKNGSKMTYDGNITPTSDTKICQLTIYLNTLYEEGILDEGIKNPSTNAPYGANAHIVVTYEKYDGSAKNANEKQKYNGNNLYEFVEG